MVVHFFAIFCHFSKNDKHPAPRSARECKETSEITGHIVLGIELFAEIKEAVVGDGFANLLHQVNQEAQVVN